MSPPFDVSQPKSAGVLPADFLAYICVCQTNAV